MLRIKYIRPIQKGLFVLFPKVSLKNSTRFTSTSIRQNNGVGIKPTSICIKPQFPKITHHSSFVTKTYKPAHWRNDPNLMEIYEAKSTTNLVSEASGYYLGRYRNFWFGVLPILYFLNAGSIAVPIFIFFFTWSNRTRIRITQILFDRSEQKILLFRPGFDSQLNTGHVLVAEFSPNSLQYSSSLKLNIFLNFRNPFNPPLQNKLYVHPLGLNEGKKTTVYEIRDNPYNLEKLKDRLQQFGVMPGDFFS